MPPRRRHKLLDVRAQPRADSEQCLVLPALAGGVAVCRAQRVLDVHAADRAGRGEAFAALRLCPAPESALRALRRPGGAGAQAQAALMIRVPQLGH
jgi:hypothetical protein